MWKDPIVQEVRKVRAAHAAKLNHDIHAIMKDAQERQRASGRKVVSFVARKQKTS